MLNVQEICKSFGQTVAVDHLDITVQKGQICGLLGPNGAGKSTTIRLICGVLAPSSGNVYIGGVNLKNNPKQAKQLLGYVPEGAPLPLELLPMEYLSHTASLYGLSRSSRKKSIESWADCCEISDVLQKPIGLLSRGYRQRVSLVAALLHQPTLLILDEPSAGLDPVQQSSFNSLLQRISESAAILYSSHHLAEVEATCDDVVIIHHGKRIAEYSFATKDSDLTITIEVSTKEVANAILGFNITELDDGWVRCEVRQPCEEIVDRIQKNGGKVRLIQPTTHSLEKMYFKLVHNSGKESDGEATR